MVSLITENFSNKPITSWNIAEANKPEKTARQEQTVTAKISQAPEKKNTVAKTILPLSLIAGGGILMYYGLKKPSKIKFFKDLANERIFKIEKHIKEYTTYSAKLIETSFDDSLGHIEDFRKNKFFDVSSHIQGIKQAKEAKDALTAQNNAFKILSADFNEYRRPGATYFDTFKVKLGNTVREVSNKIEGKRWKTNIACQDLTLMPKFQNGENGLLVDETEKKLIALTQSAYSEMLHFKKEKLHNVIHSQSKSMADAIIEMRTSVSNAKKLLIDSTFEKFRRLLNLPEDFLPNYNKVPTTDNFTKLTLEELKPQKLPSRFDELFDYSTYWNAVKTKDFAKLNAEDLRRIFYSSSPFDNINDIGIMIDRLRLYNELEKSAGKANEKLYKNTIAKLENLRAKLHEFGEMELVSRCKYDFNNITPQQRMGRLYYINEVSRRLGFNTLADMNEYFKSNNTYQQSGLPKFINIIMDNPEMYFI